MEEKRPDGGAGDGKFDSAETYVPPADFQTSEAGRKVYLQAQAELRAAIASLGVQDGVSMFISGVTRELRRHLTVEAAQDMLRGLADTMPEVAKYDR